jgi:hypothetical protein
MTDLDGQEREALMAFVPRDPPPGMNAHAADFLDGYRAALAAREEPQEFFNSAGPGGDATNAETGEITPHGNALPAMFDREGPTPSVVERRMTKALHRIYAITPIGSDAAEIARRALKGIEEPGTPENRRLDRENR